jgi:hypothetical protein
MAAGIASLLLLGEVSRCRHSDRLWSCNFAQLIAACKLTNYRRCQVAYHQSSGCRVCWASLHTSSYEGIVNLLLS